MRWDTSPLGELCDRGNGVVQTGPFGSQLHKADYKEIGVPVVMPKDIVGDALSVKSIARIEEATAERLHRHRLQQGDVVYGRRGDIGRRALVGPHHRGWLCGTGCMLVRVGESLDPRYLYYYLGQASVVGWIAYRAIGATMPNLNTAILRSVPIRFPAAPAAQRRIANILSAYDDLIENNTRRIKILEEMAQRIYREWFVHFRFPGHENVPLVESELGPIPEGWEVSELGTQLRALESGKRPRGGASGQATGVPSVGAENIVGVGRHRYESEKYVPREFFERMKTGVVQDGDVALYKDGANIGRSSYFRDGFPHAELCVNDHVFLLRASGQQLRQSALYLWLREPSTVETVRATNSNSAQPGINKKKVSGVRIVVPMEATCMNFDELIDPYFALIVNLAKKNEILRTTRNLLLPKLISGEIPVDAAENVGTELAGQTA